MPRSTPNSSGYFSSVTDVTHKPIRDPKRSGARPFRNKRFSIHHDITSTPIMCGSSSPVVVTLSLWITVGGRRFGCQSGWLLVVRMACGLQCNQQARPVVAAATASLMRRPMQQLWQWYSDEIDEAAAETAGSRSEVAKAAAQTAEVVAVAAAAGVCRHSPQTNQSLYVFCRKLFALHLFRNFHLY